MDKLLLSEKTKDIEKGFIPCLPKEEGYEKTVLEAMNYSIKAGGKRLRPMFMYESYKMFGGEKESLIRPFMMAIEMIHTYSLVHDDLPAMDNDDYRRGMLTTHKKYGEDMGILTGDALLNNAFETAFIAFDSDEKYYLRIAKALKVLGNKAGIHGMVGGQVVDVENNGVFIDNETLMYVHKNKTAALIESSLMIGSILAGASDDEVSQIEKVGTMIGIAFQIQDDILDVIGDEDKLGKPIHSDEENEKTTYVSLHGIEKSKKEVEKYTTEGLDTLLSINAKNEDSKEFLKQLFEYLVKREY